MGQNATRSSSEPAPYALLELSPMAPTRELSWHGYCLLIGRLDDTYFNTITPSSRGV